MISSRDQPALRQYTKFKHAVARRIRAVEHELHVHGADDQVAACRQLMTHLAEDRFTLAVLGQFKRGKSSLMNAIVGEPLLPTGVLPLTSAVTVLRFGPVRRLLIMRRGWSVEVEEPLSALPEFATEQGNPGNSKQIETVYVEHPSPFLRRGLEFVDTPGVGSAIEANTATTYDFIPRCDAAVFVTAADAPLGAAELDFLGSIRKQVHKIFLVVNKIDLLRAQERESVLGFMIDRLRLEFAGSPARLYPLSAQLAIQASVSRNELALAESGLPQLESDLAAFLTEGRMATLLVSSLDRAERLLGAVGDQGHRQRRTIRALREQILAYDRGSSIEADSDSLSRPLESDHEIGRQDVPGGTTNIQGGRTCQVCSRLTRVLMDFLAEWQFLLATSEEAQISFAEAGGYCPLHTWQLADLSSPQGLSAGYSILLERFTGDLRDAARDPGRAPEATHQPDTCRMCLLLAEREREEVLRLASSMAHPNGREMYAGSQGVCLRHLGSLLGVIPNGEDKAFVLELAARRMDELSEDMQNFAIKQTGLRRHLQNRDEVDAYLRGVTQVVGRRQLCAPKARM